MAEMAEPTPPAKRSRALPRKLDSASTLSKTARQLDSRFLKWDVDSQSLEFCVEKKSYSLRSLYRSSSGRSSEQNCRDYLRQILPQDWKFTVMKKLTILSNLPPLVCTVDQRPDITVYPPASDIPVTIVEVHSSPYESTIKKCLTGVVDLLRVYRSYDTSRTQSVGYAFPKLDSNQCVVRVLVTWTNLSFRYALTLLETPEDVREDLERLTSLSMPHADTVQQCAFVIRLSSSDLREFGNGAEQEPSQSSILVHNTDNYYYKYPFDIEERETLHEIGFSTLAMQLDVADLHRITFNPVKKGALLFMEYKEVTHCPLTVDEASKCLKALVKELHEAIQAFHNEGWAHADIRLPNVCFDARCRPILIDLDRSVMKQESVAAKYGHDSCMYTKKVGALADYVQLAWLATYVVRPDIDSYHNRKFCDLEEKFQQDNFFKTLVEQGMW